MLTCPSCGRENPAGSRFCNPCGTGLGESVDPEALRALLARYIDETKAIVAHRLVVLHEETRALLAESAVTS